MPPDPTTKTLPEMLSNELLQGFYAPVIRAVVGGDVYHIELKDGAPLMYHARCRGYTISPADIAARRCSHCGKVLNEMANTPAPGNIGVLHHAADPCETGARSGAETTSSATKVNCPACLAKMAKKERIEPERR